MNEHGPETICQRTTCAEVPPHKAGRHLDQRDELYDGPGSLLRAMPLAVRESARKIVRDAPELMPEVVDLAREIQRLRDQITHISVDRDHKVRDAMAGSESCEHHGEEIKALGDQLSHFDQSYHRADAGRVALLGFLHTVDELVRGAEAGALYEDVTVSRVMEALAKASKITHAAHERAWKK